MPVTVPLSSWPLGNVPAMDTVVVAARLVLAGVLTVAAVAKFVDLEAFARATRSLGVADRFVPALRVGVPFVELLLAVGLLLTPVAPFAAIGALLVFLGFTALLVWNLAQGRRPACNCFGRSADEPISWWSVARNVALAVLTGLAVGGDHDGLPAWVSSQFDGAALARVAAVLAGLLVVVAAAAVALLRNDWRPSRRRSSRRQGSSESGLEVGVDVSDVALGIRLDNDLAAELPVLVIRTDPECGPCRALLPRLLSWQSAYAGIVEFVVVTGDVEGHDHYDQVAHLVTDGISVAARLKLDVTPSAVLVGSDGRIASSVAAGTVEIGGLVSEAVQVDGVSHLTQGDPANGVVLSSGHGLVSIADLQGALTLVLFWDPWCGFCQRALLPMLQWQESIAETGQRLLVAGQRDDEIARLQGFRLVGADTDGSVMRLFGGEGTPSAVLVDATGRVASDIAHGLDEVLALAARSDLLTSLGSATKT